MTGGNLSVQKFVRMSKTQNPYNPPTPLTPRIEKVTEQLDRD